MIKSKRLQIEELLSYWRSISVPEDEGSVCSIVISVKFAIRLLDSLWLISWLSRPFLDKPVLLSRSLDDCLDSPNYTA